MAEDRKITGIKCTSCGKTFKMYVPAAGGIRKVNCPHCKAEIKINFGTPKPAEEKPADTTPEAPQQPPKKTKDISDINGSGMQRGKLVEVRGFLKKNISHTLQIGDNIIGQYDMEMPSTIMIKDSTVSRKSVNINVIYEDDHLDYVFCVLRAKNPVTLNGTPVQVGEKRYLKFGDQIILGLTKFRFEQA